jgi:predicted dehydrogenase
LGHHPQAVIIANPTALHMDVAIPAADRGCHLLIEKPLSHSLEGIQQLQKAVRRGGGQVLVGFQFRFHPGLQKIKQLLTPNASLPSSPIGRPLSVRAQWGEYLPGWHPWEDYRQGYSARLDLGGGAILTLSHPLDYLRWFFGEVEALWAFAGRLGDLALDVEDTAEIGLRFTGGALGSVHLDYNQRPSVHSLEVVGTQGTICWDNADGAVCVYQSPEGAEHVSTLRFPVPPGFERNDLFLAEIRHFLALARGEEVPACTLEDGIHALNLALAARRSAETGEIAIL